MRWTAMRLVVAVVVTTSVTSLPTIGPPTATASTPATLVDVQWGDAGHVALLDDIDDVDTLGADLGWTFGAVDGLAAAWRVYPPATDTVVLGIPSRALVVFARDNSQLWLGGSTGTGEDERPIVARFDRATQFDLLLSARSFGNDGVATVGLDGPGRVTRITSSTARGQVTIDGTLYSFEVPIGDTGMGTPLVVDDGGASGAPTPGSGSPEDVPEACPCPQPVVMADGSVLVVSANTATTRVRRITPAGSYDPSYGDGGVAAFAAATVHGQAHALPDGGVLLTGWRDVVRILPSGVRDVTFAGDGRLELSGERPLTTVVFGTGDFVLVRRSSIEHWSAGGSFVGTWPVPVDADIERAWTSPYDQLRIATYVDYVGFAVFEYSPPTVGGQQIPVRVEWADISLQHYRLAGTSLFDELPNGVGAVAATRVPALMGYDWPVGVARLTDRSCCLDQRAERTLPGSEELLPAWVKTRGSDVYLAAIDATDGSQGVLLRLRSNLAVDPTFGDGGRVDLPYAILDPREFPDGDLLVSSRAGDDPELVRLQLPPTRHDPAPTGAYTPLRDPRLVLDRTGSKDVSAKVAAPGGRLLAPGTLAALVEVEVRSPTRAGRVTLVTGATGPAGLPVLDFVARSGNWSTMAVVPLGPDGQITVRRSASVRVRVEVHGGFVAATSARAGRLELTAPRSLIHQYIRWPRARLNNTVMPVPEAAGQAGALVQVATTGRFSGGTVSFRGGGRRITFSVPRNATTSFPTIIPVDADGSFRVSTSSGVTLRLELQGTVTGPGAPLTSAGLLALVPGGVAPLQFGPNEGGEVTGQKARVSAMALVPHGAPVLVSLTAAMGTDALHNHTDASLLTYRAARPPVYPSPPIPRRFIIDGLLPGRRLTAQGLELARIGDLYLQIAEPSTLDARVLGWLVPDPPAA